MASLRMKKIRRLLLIVALSASVLPAWADANPDWTEVNKEIENLAQIYEIPAELIKAIAQVESNWCQWLPDGRVKKNPTSGATGMMQICGSTKKNFDEARLETDWKYNLEAGVKVLNGKWGFVKALGIEKPGFPDRDRRLLENWYYPLNFYGGDLSGKYTDYIFGRLENRPGPLAKALPAPVLVTRPVNVLTGFKFRDYFVAVKDGLIGPDKALVKCETHPGTIPSMATLAQEEQIRTMFEAAKKAHDGGDISAAAQRLRKIMQLDVRAQDKQPAKDLLSTIEAAAKARLAEAEGFFAAQKFAEALAAYDDVADRYPGFDAAKAAAQKAASMAKDPAVAKARETARRRDEAEGLFARAAKYEEAEDPFGAWSIYRMLADGYKETDPAAAAGARLAALEADPATMAVIREKEKEIECHRWMTLARNYQKGRLFDKALEFYRKVAEKYPDAPQAALAKKEVKAIEDYLKE
jgi:tetratricopeptide (TPR) repeat protein